MSNGDTTNLGPGAPQLESTAGPRFSVIDMGAMVGPERMDTMGMLRAELRSVYEDNSMVRTINRAVADPGDALIRLLKPLIVLVALVVGFVAAALIMESSAGATPPTEAVQPAVPEPAVAALVADEEELTDELAEEELAEEQEVVEEAEAEEPEPAVAEETKEPVRKVRKSSKRAKRKKHKKRKRRRRRR